MRSLPHALLFAALLALSACEDRGACVRAPEGYASSPDEAVNRYRAAYMQRNPAALDELLADDFQYRIVASDADSLGRSRQWGKTTELEWAQRMLTGMSGTRVDSLPQCPIDLTFFLSVPPRDGSSWTLQTSGPFAGTEMREFRVVGQVGVGSAGLDFFQGLQRIYVRRDVIDEFDCLAYRIAYWDDLGTQSVIAKHGFFSWGRVRARWRPDAPPPKEPCP